MYDFYSQPILKKIPIDLPEVALFKPTSNHPISRSEGNASLDNESSQQNFMSMNILGRNSVQDSPIYKTRSITKLKLNVDMENLGLSLLNTVSSRKKLRTRQMKFYSYNLRIRPR